MPVLSAATDSMQEREDETLLTLCTLAGEESGGFIHFHPHIPDAIRRTLFSGETLAAPAVVTGGIMVRELTVSEMIWAERELWIHYHQQKADRQRDRLFAVFTGQKIIGVARCTRHQDGLEVDSVYVLDEYRLKGYARSVMHLLIEECGRNETLYMHSKTELVDFYGSLGFRPIRERDLPKTIRDRFDFCLGNLGGIDVLPMKRDPGYKDTETA